MPRIEQLSTSIINKIAAGEVIERPASAVKELIENAVDAGATRVDVTIEEGGSRLIRVVDDGHGIAADQMELAIASHATSKIRSADDLFCVRTLGFRGEALASISEVSQMTLRSRTADEEVGNIFEISGGQRSNLRPTGCPTGTLVEVRNLFFNTPVRRKYLKTVQTEMGHITEAFTRIALVYCDIHFSIKHNGRLIHDLPAVDNWKDRIAHFFGRDLAQGLIWVESEIDDVVISGYVADPTFFRSHTRMQFLFLNGRHIRDRSLQHALGESYRGLLIHGRYPIAFLKMDMPAEMVDVNVHPTKLEVRFQDSRKMYSQVLSTIRNKFLATDLTARIRESGQGDEQAVPTELASETNPQFNFNAAPATSDVWGIGGRSPQMPDSFRQALEPTNITSATLTEQPSDRSQVPSETLDGRVVFNSAERSSWGIQVQNRYIITEDERGMLVIDQHALHERILYEQIREKVLAGELEIQRLLVPEPVTLASAECALVLEQQDQLQQLGLEVEAFGGDTVLVSSYPAMLRRVRIEELLRSVIEIMIVDGEQLDKRDLLDELMHMMSCKGAVKAGDSLTSDEIESLLEWRALCQDSHHCPHGRPTSLVFTQAELDKRFQRTGI
ncbi:MAG: DNA mismatch repair endonuclease MutL [Planctomycetaceae bacterium]|jgi:DNA mismatch repair protein MutL|nr:DNA mismatch repair endonuclease MutL [Planctomycetaceae bacterium]MBT4725248.1 DNA mismatch repair endonuclease MutL [Planctomycetaceae bacterium]MBT4845403.1 DNA mismatch repair endonuclease MutL [Planctomycetaceae bacterium]MBT5123001.1 DNA mismatch repair endonuclease MutL [Planctomycetaceae bacterium]MBT5599701.1 DNA mismatch repair endonuclease MutL [Planctomycetaceae bacterium]